MSNVPLSSVEKAVLLHGIRWTKNILVELLGNYSGRMSRPVRERLMTAISELEETAVLLREF
jgi:hypothetical protein